MEFTYTARLTPPNQKVLDIIQSAWEDERGSEAWIHRLIKLAKDPSDKEMLRTLRMDEHKHVKYFGEIYKKLSGCPLPQNEDIAQKPLGWNFYAECEKMMLKCTENVEFYRRIYFGFTDQDIRDTLFEIMTDEMNMAVKMTHLCNKNREFY